MKQTLKNSKYQNIPASLLFVLALFFVLGLGFDFYYDYNDDVLIQDIVSGRFSGSPDAHCMHLLYPLGLLLCLLYELAPQFPWYALFLCSCMGISLFSITYRSLSHCKNILPKTLFLVTEAVLLFVLLLYELVFVQFTVVAGFLTTAALFLFITTPKELEPKEFLKKNIATVILALLGFCVRPNMFFLCSPFIAAVGIFHWSREKNILARETIVKYIGVIGAVLLGIGAGMLLDKLAYQSQDWQEFTRLNAARSQLYDFTGYPTYEEAENYYTEINVSRSQYQLIDTYNYTLDESIDATLLENVASYHQEKVSAEAFWPNLFDAIKSILYRTIFDVDRPHNYFVIAAYVLLIAAAIRAKDKSYFWKLPLLLLFRMIPWLYLVMSDRVPQRIVHPLYCAELLILLTLTAGLLKECRKFSKLKAGFIAGTFVIFGILSLCFWKLSYETVKYEALNREQNNICWNAFESYAKENPDNFYCLDVYSTVIYKDKIFKASDHSQKNYDLMGGWIAKSPLQREALSNFTSTEKESLAQALLGDHFYFVIDPNRSYEFLIDYYADQGKNVELQEITRFGQDQTTLIVYKVVEQ